MSITQTSVESGFKYRNLSSLKKWLFFVILNEGCKIGNISIVFTSDSYLLKINQEFLGHDFYTDVISFDYCTGSVINGEILVSTDRVKENAHKFDVKFKEEIDRVILHGILHLIGYSDKVRQDKIRMEERECYYLEFRSIY